MKNKIQKIPLIGERGAEGLAELSTLFALMAAAATATSLCYRAGFFGAIDNRLLQFLSLSDILPSSAHFVAWTLFWLAFGWAYGRYFLKTADPAVSGNTSDWLGRKFFLILCVMSIFPAVLAPFSPRPFEGLFLLSVIAGTSGVFWAVGKQFEPIGHLTSNALKLLTGIAAICVIVFFRGGFEGEIVMRKRMPDVSIALTNGRTEIGVLVWTSSEIVFIRDDIRKIKLIPRDQIASVELFGVNDWTPLISLHKVWSWWTKKDANPVSH
jgi:hypothetical protein